MSRTLSATPTGGDGSSVAAGAGEIVLFGVRVVVDSMRKSVSMNNLSQYEHPQDGSNNTKEDVVAAGYASADEAVVHDSRKHRERERKRGVPWTEEEHKLFLLGLQKVGKGDWRGISKNYVKTRTPTQVASHAQKYFLRKSNLNRRRRRSSLFDITTDTVSGIPMEEQIQHPNNMPNSHLGHPATSETNNINGFSMMQVYPMGVSSGLISFPSGNPMENLTLGQGNSKYKEPMKLVHPIPIADPKAFTVSDIAPRSSSTIDPPTLSLGLSLSSDQRKTSSRHSGLHAIPCLNNSGDSIISVA
ncbi:transcription factor MYB1R1-like [Senna tora]|uniref:Transcription factor MYB1R1-like n=1 Tax=Senna tora TaxID=362788 RepID=A0A834X6L7_9FABA|nr:transcription factor MYB1R1-like [Senna tora]